MITKNLKHRIIGGGCRSSKVQVYYPQQINLSQKNGFLDQRFMQNYEDFTDKKKIAENIEYKRQGVMQMDIIQCLKSSNDHIRRNIIIYKPKLMNLIDVYLIYVLTGSSQNEVLKINQIKELGSQLKDMKESFEMESRDQPSCDLIFYFDILYRFNSTRIGKNEQNKNQLIQSVEFLTNIVKLGSGALKTLGGNFMEGFDLAQKGAQSLLKSYQKSKTNQLFSYLLDIWMKKTTQFSDKIWNLTLLEELQFNITIFNELCSQKEYETDLVLLTLIKIDHYFSLAVEDLDTLKILSQDLSLNCNLIKTFIPMLISKSDSQSIFDEMKSFLKFTVENHTYRYLTISILLKYNKVISDINDSEHYKEQILEYLCYKYLCEKDKSVKLAFETSKEFVDHFNSKIKQEQFQDKIIQLSNERRKVLQILDLEKYEEKIDNSQDIERMIVNTIIDKWERDVKRRQQENIAQKDDVLLEVKDLYIEQSIKYLQGNKIIQSKHSLSQINQNQPNQRSNALQEILEDFLQNSSKQVKDNKIVNTPNSEIQNRCKILGILAEGGTGKSMLIKKLETHLIQIANTNQEKENYIPLLIKCNSLDPVSPSIENYLQAQGVNHQQINAIKESDRNKVILLDGYDEFIGEYFRVYKQLNLNKWKNTKVIVSSRKEKLDLSDACVKFSLDGDNGLRDEASFCIVKLEEFTNEDILEYCNMYFRQQRTIEQQFDELQFQKDMDAMRDCIQNPSLISLLFLPINLYLFSRMIVQVKELTEIQKIKEKITDQIGIQEIFFNEQFKREAQDFVQTQVKEPSKTNNEFVQLIINSYFEYFQSISLQMYLSKGKSQNANFLTIRKDQIQFNLSSKAESKLSEKEQNSLHQKIIHYVNSKIITRQKEETSNNLNNENQNKSYLIEFKHKSLFEYFIARAMKYDFDIHGENIYNLNIEQLKEFAINQKSIMNAGHNQSEQQILIKLYKMIKNEIESNEFYSTYYLESIQENSRYIQYIKSSTIKRNTETSQIDIGASNMLSVLFVSKFSYLKLELNSCSLSKLYVSTKKSDSINFNNCNLQHSYLKDLHINYDSCNTQFASFDAFQKVFDTLNIYSFNQVIWDKRNILYSISQSGFINAFKIENQNILLQKSKQLSQTPLIQILIINNENLLISSQYSLLVINQSTFELLESQKFKNEIKCITLIKENILIMFQNETIFYGSFKFGFKKLDIMGQGCLYNEPQQILLVYTTGIFTLYKIEKDFKIIKRMLGHFKNILSVAFSADGKYIATGSEDKSCKIWNVEEDFELIATIEGNNQNSDDQSNDENFISGHSSSIISVTFSTDGKYIATGSKDKTCKIWNAEKNFNLIHTIQGQNSAIHSVTFSEDGKYLATGSHDKYCKIWYVEKDFELIKSIQGHTEPVISVAFTIDGKYLATSSHDSTCKIWNPEKGFQLLNTNLSHNGSIYSVTFSTDGKYLATGSQDKICKIWNAEKNFELIHIIQGHTDEIGSVAFSTDGKYLATGSDDKTCKIWNSEQGFELTSTILGHTKAIYSVSFSPGGKYLATGSQDNTCKIWNTEKSFVCINTIQGHTKGLFSVSFSVDGKLFATGSVDKTCKIWNVEKNFELINTIQGHYDFIHSAVFSTDGKYLATASKDQTCKIWNVEKNFELINTIQGHTSYLRSVAFSADGKYLATGSSDCSSKIWNPERGFELINTIQGHTVPVNFLAFSLDGKYLATGSNDKTCKIWSAGKGFELINTIQGHTSSVFSVAFSVDGKYIATGSLDSTCKIWNTDKGFQLFKTLQDHTDLVLNVAFSADGKHLITSSKDKTCKIWNVEQGFEFINTIQGHSGTVIAVAFSSDGKYLVTGSDDKSCKIWNVKKSYELIKTIEGDSKLEGMSFAFSDDEEEFYQKQGHTDSVFSVAFSVDGKYLVTGSLDNTFKIWDSEKDFEIINTIYDHNECVRSVSFSSDGKYLATGSSDSTCKIWNIEKGFELINTIYGHTKSIESVAFSPDGKYLTTSSIDETCKIWNVEKGFELINEILDQDGKNKEGLQNFEIMNEQSKRKKKLFQFEQNENIDFVNMQIFENIYIL